MYVHSLGAGELQTDDVEHLLAWPAALIVLRPLPHLHAEVILPRHVNHVQLSHGAWGGVHMYMYMYGNILPELIDCYWPKHVLFIG